MSENAIKHTFTYKKVGDTPLDLDVYLPGPPNAPPAHLRFGDEEENDREEGAAGRPLLIFWHGGGLTVGSKEWRHKWLFYDALDAGFAVLTANYSLLSPATAHDILADLKDLNKWVNTQLNRSLTGVSSDSIDVERVVVAGVSAGAYLTYQSAIHFVPKPRAVFTLYGLGGNLLSDFILHPKTEPYIGTQPFEGHPRTFQPLITDPTPFALIQSSTEPVFEAVAGPRGAYCEWLLQEGNYLDIFTGIPGLSQKLAALPAEARPGAVPAEARVLFPQLAQVTRESVPVLMLHGVEDTLVKVAESEAVKRRYDAAGASAELVVLEGREHGWEYQWTESSGGLERVVPFLVEHVRRRQSPEAIEMA